MTDEELKKKLSLLKTSKVPAGYWDSYWPRLKLKIAAWPDFNEEPQRNRRTRFGWLLPLMAGAALASGGYLAVEKAKPSRPKETVLLMADVPALQLTEKSQAEKIFSELFALFPQRVNWVSYARGKMDFSVSSLAYPSKEDLIPLIAAFQMGKQTFYVQLILREGQEATVHTVLDDGAKLELAIRLSEKGAQTVVNLKLLNDTMSASMAAQTLLHENQSAVLGALLWKKDLVQIQLQRLSKPKMGANAS